MEEPGTMAAGDLGVPEAAAPPGRRRSSLGVVFLTLFLDLAGFSIIFPLTPSLLEYYLGREGRDGLLGSLIRAIESAGAGSDPIYTAALFGGVLGSIYSLLQFLFAPFWGSLSDRTGRKPILIISNAGLALSYLLWAFSGNFLLFVLSRFLAGAASGNISVATAAAADVTSRKERSKEMVVVWIAFGLGFILGPALGAAFSHIDLSARFPALAPLGLNPFSMAAFGAFLLAAFNLLWVSFRFDETLPPESRGRATESRTLNPLAFFRKFEFPGVRRTNVIWFIYLLAFSGMEFTLTFLAHRRFDYTPRMNGLLFVYVGALMVLVQGGLVRRLVPRLGEKKVVAAGIAFSVPGFLLMGWAPTQGILYLGLGLMAMGSGLSQIGRAHV